MTAIITADLLGEISAKTVPAKPRSRQAQLGQYLTPHRISAFMAGLFPPLPEDIRMEWKRVVG
jgi:hypothetical protein